MTKAEPAAANVFEFINRLREARIHFSLASHREDSIMVQIAVPGERWEVEFFKAGTVEVERFRSDGQISDQSSIEILFKLFAEPNGSAKEGTM